MWLPWEPAAIGAALMFGIGWLLRRRNTHHGLAALATETGIVAALYALWQLAGRISVFDVDGAISRGEWLWDLERTLLIPNEETWQNAIEPFSWLVQASNIYYGGAHVPGMGIFLVWLFFARRDAYPQWRNALAWLTGLCLVGQLLAVAPPRLIDSLDIADTGVQYGQSVYATFNGSAGQLQAMPSIHVGWAVLIGWAVYQLVDGPWRWIGWVHAALTAYVVVVTGNHFWLDGVVAVLILMAIRAAQRGINQSPLLHGWRSRSRSHQHQPEKSQSEIRA